MGKNMAPVGKENPFNIDDEKVFEHGRVQLRYSELRGRAVMSLYQPGITGGNVFWVTVEAVVASGESAVGPLDLFERIIQHCAYESHSGDYLKVQKEYLAEFDPQIMVSREKLKRWLRKLKYPGTDWEAHHRDVLDELAETMNQEFNEKLSALAK